MDGLQCERRLWMHVNRPEQKREPTLAEQYRMDSGTEFGREVTKLFPGGVEITADYRHPKDALDQTAEALLGDAPALFEAAFLHEGVLIRADVLERSKAAPDSWRLIEVKSASNGSSGRSAKLKKHVSDMAVQLYVLEGSGVSVEAASLAWVNSKYERVGELDWASLVAIEEQTDAVRARSTTVGGELAGFQDMIRRPDMPDATFQKTKCGGCAFSEACWAGVPTDSVIFLPRISPTKLDELDACGVERISEIPDDFELTPTQRPVVRALNYPSGHIADPEQLGSWLSSLIYPLYYFDFEAWAPCVPPFDRTRPYQQIPFQYSVHVQAAPGSDPTHLEFLAGPAGDPRPQLIKRLLDDLGEQGSIVVHHAQFESSRIKELAEFSPQDKSRLHALLSRIVDTEVPFAGNWYLHPGLQGRSSIKVVLPTLAPELTYEGLEISEGQAASIAFEKMFEGAVVGEEAQRSRQSLLEYCKMDTLAMVKIVERLQEVMGAS